MALYESWDLDIPDGAMITHVGFPRDDSTSSASEDIRLEIFMGPSTLDVKNVTSTFASNYGGARTNVFARQIVTLPALSGPVFNAVWIELDTPYVYDKSKNLLVEYVVDANSNAGKPFNYYLDYGRFQAPTEQFGHSCPNSGGEVALLKSSRTAIGQSWALQLTRGPRSAGIAILFGVRRLDPPLALDPFGMPGCELLLDVLWSTPYTLSSGGSLFLSYPIPEERTLVGGRIQTQAVMEDPFANDLGLITSNGDQMELGIEPLMTLIRTQDLSRATGSVSRNWGAISLFGYK